MTVAVSIIYYELLSVTEVCTYIVIIDETVEIFIIILLFEKKWAMAKKIQQ